MSIIEWTRDVRDLLKKEDTLNIPMIFAGDLTIDTSIYENPSVSIFLESMMDFARCYKDLAIRFTYVILPTLGEKWMIIGHSNKIYNHFIQTCLTFTAHKVLYDAIILRLGEAYRQERNLWKPSVFVTNTWDELIGFEKLTI